VYHTPQLPPPKPHKKAAAATAGPAPARRTTPSKKKKKGKAAPALLPAIKCPHRGVTRHRRSGRYEAHLWLKSHGRQAFLGGWSSAGAAAAAIDLVALKSYFDAHQRWPAIAALFEGGGGAVSPPHHARVAAAATAIAAVPALNLPPATYVACLPALAAASLDGLVADLRAQSKVARGPADGPSLGSVHWAALAGAAGGLGEDGTPPPQPAPAAAGVVEAAQVAAALPPAPAGGGAPLHQHRLSGPAGGGGGGLVLPHKARAKRSASAPW